VKKVAQGRRPGNIFKSQNVHSTQFKWKCDSLFK